MRESLSALLALAVLGWASAAPASTTGRPARLGLLDYSAPDEGRARWWDAFRAGLRDLGYVEGRDVRFEPRWANGRSDRLPQLAAELVGLPVDVIVTAGSDAAAAAKRATATIPIVMATGSDPVALGLVGSFARPGGNVTAVTSLTSDLSGKRLEILRELLPRVSRIGLLWDSSNRSAALSVTEAEAAARPLGVRVHAVGVHAESELAAALSALKRRGAVAVFVVASPALFPLRRTIADLALRHRLPIMVGGREYAEAGGLVSYAVYYPDLFRRAAIYVDKILRGSKPGDLPVEQPTRFELVINTKTATALGMTIPQALLVRADELIR